MTTQLKRAVVDRARSCCEYCRSQMRFASQPFVLDHIIPKSRGGETTLENLALACQGCNNYKYAKIDALDPVSAERVELFHPRKQHWYEHFAWDDGFTHLIGLTATGRATIEALRLNRTELLEFRRFLRSAGVHPPVEPNDGG